MIRKYRVFMDMDGMPHLIKSKEEEEFLSGNPGIFKKWLTDWTEYDAEQSPDAIPQVFRSGRFTNLGAG